MSLKNVLLLVQRELSLRVHIFSLHRRSTQKYRKYRQCPVQGCTVKPQKKLSQHLLKYHANLTGKERRRMHKIARIVSRNYLKTDSGQTKLPFKPSHLASTSRGKDRRAPKGRALTKGLPYFPSTHPKLAPFKDYLMGPAGRKRKEKIADSIVRDISKMLYFYDSQSIKWEAIRQQKPPQVHEPPG